MALAAVSASRVSAQVVNSLPRAADVPDSASFLAVDLSNGAQWVLDGSDIDARHTPFSTFKIPNLLIALETGVESSLDAHRDWDSDRRPPALWWPDVWERDHTLRTAFQESVVWYFRDIALAVGTERYRDFLSAWNYGNANVPDGSDDFWVTGALTISVTEQVQFLSNLLRGNLGLSDAARIALVEAAWAEERGNVTLHGKTGGGYSDGWAKGWYVGFLTRTDAAPVVFALHLRGATWASIRDVRRPLAERLLQEAGFWPEA